MALASQSEQLARSAVRLQAIVGELVWLPKGTPLDGAAVAAALGSLATVIEAEDEVEARAQAEALVDRTTRWLIATHLQLTRRP